MRESQRVELLRTLSFMTMLKMLTAQQPERARTYYFAGLKALYESFLIYQVLCHHSKYSLSGGQNESTLGNHGKYRIPARGEAHFTLKYSMLPKNPLK